MLVIRIELWPGGRESLAKTIGTGVIANDGTAGDICVGNYDAWFGGVDEPDPFELIDDFPAARVEGFPRLKRDAWNLLGQALAQLEET